MIRDDNYRGEDDAEYFLFNPSNGFHYDAHDHTAVPTILVSTGSYQFSTCYCSLGYAIADAHTDANVSYVLV